MYTIYSYRYLFLAYCFSLLLTFLLGLLVKSLFFLHVVIWIVKFFNRLNVAEQDGIAEEVVGDRTGAIAHSPTSALSSQALGAMAQQAPNIDNLSPISPRR